MAKQNGRESTDKQDLPKAKLNKENLKKSLRLFQYLKQQRWKFVLGMLFLAGTAATGLYFPLISGKMIGLFGDKISSQDFLNEQLLNLGKTLLIVLLIQGVVSFGRVYMFSMVTENILQGVRNDVFKRLVQMPMSFFSKNQVSELNSRIATDINVISEAFSTNVAELVRQIIVGVGCLILIYRATSWEIAQWFLVVIPPITIIAIVFGRKVRKFSRGMQDKIAESNVIVGEALTGITNVKTFTNEKFEINRYQRVTQGIKDFGIKYGVFKGTFFTFIIIFVFGSIFFILFQMIQMKNTGKLTSEQFGEFLMLALFVAASLGGLPEQIASIQRAMGATERVFELIDGNIEHIDLQAGKLSSQQVKQGEIEFKQVAFHYPSRPDYQVLKEVSFKAERGQTVALVGPSGSGKTTIASLVLRFYDPVKGQVLIDGTDTREYSLTALRQQMALVPQDVILFAGSIKDNILYGRPDATFEEVREAARKANALDFIDGFPDKFETRVGERGVQLSGGQRQRIAIARAVLKNPAILILDEATSSLDSESEHLVQEALDKLMKNRTSIVIAHRLSTIRNADKIIVLEKGQVKESGTHQQLINIEDGLYRNLNRLQLELNA